VGKVTNKFNFQRKKVVFPLRKVLERIPNESELVFKVEFHVSSCPAGITSPLIELVEECTEQAS